MFQTIQSSLKRSRTSEQRLRRDNAFNKLREETNTQLEQMNAILRTRFSDYPGSGGSGGSELGEGSGTT
ncbi:unnamed protein product [Cochlearia groenlandica]